MQIDCRPFDGQATIGTGPQQGGQAVALQPDLFFGLKQIAFGAGPTCIGFAQAALGLKAIGKALREQGGGLAANFHRACGGVTGCEQSGQFHVVGRDGGGQAQTRLRELSAAGFGFRGGSGQRSAVLAPEVEFPADIQCCPAVILPAFRGHKLGRQVVGTLALLGR